MVLAKQQVCLTQSVYSKSLNFFVTVLWVVAIIGVCYDVTKLIEVSGIQVYYEYGCYTITAAGRKLIESDSCYMCVVVTTGWTCRGMECHTEGITVLQ
jgi:hypothetical protein